MKTRLDTLLHQKGLFESRSKAAAAIEEGRVSVDGEVILKTAFSADEDAEIVIRKGDAFVSRAYRKLKAALDEFHVSPAGETAIDIGASTGGFTQCLLEHGVKKVYAVDVGTNQLHPSIKSDPRVVNMEATNARTLTKNNFPEEITLAVMDVSFISQSKIYPAVSDILINGGKMISLIKPQFEVGRENIGKNGIVKDKSGKLIEKVKESLKQSAAENGLYMKLFTASPITGGDGNKEYLALFIKERNA
jgi:23S rRNA (cytidine1920-2'-O)/16S rRNA (cytidine1409-2'-O)-methyltransferase